MATLSYAYSESVVWLEDLAPESHPMVHDLCDLHATNVRVPRGWTLRDGRRAGAAAAHGGATGLRLVGA